MTNQTKNPLFWCFVAFVLGIALLIWGVNRNDVIGNYKGAGFLIWAGCILIVGGGLIGWQVYGNRKK